MAESEHLWARYYRLSDDFEAAHHHAQRALTHASHPRQPLALMAAHRLLGELAMTGEHYAEAHQHLKASLELAAACAAPYEQALTLLSSAELGAVTGKPEWARRQFDQVRAICAPASYRNRRKSRCPAR